MDANDIADKVREQNWKTGGHHVMDSDEAATLIQSAIDKERARCAAIVQAARFGEVSQDFRAIVSMIESGASAETLKA